MRWNIFMCLFSICACSLVRCLLRSLSHIKIGCLFSCWVLRVLCIFGLAVSFVFTMCLLSIFFLSLWLVFPFPLKLRLFEKKSHDSCVIAKTWSQELIFTFLQSCSEHLLYSVQSYKHFGLDWTKQLPASIQHWSSGLIFLYLITRIFKAIVTKFVSHPSLISFTLIL